MTCLLSRDKHLYRVWLQTTGKQAGQQIADADATAPHLHLMPEPRLAAAARDKEWDWDYWEDCSTSAPRAASFVLMPFQPLVRLCLLIPFLLGSPGPVVSDQLHPCLSSCLYPARHATHRPSGRMVPPGMNGKKRRSLSRRLLYMESNDLHFGLGKWMHCTSHMDDQEKEQILNGRVL